MADEKASPAQEPATAPAPEVFWRFAWLVGLLLLLMIIAACWLGELT